MRVSAWRKEVVRSIKSSTTLYLKTQIWMDYPVFNQFSCLLMLNELRKRLTKADYNAFILKLDIESERKHEQEMASTRVQL
jgi:hypothetical protein